MENFVLERGGTGRERRRFLEGLETLGCNGTDRDMGGGTRMGESGRKIAKRIQVVKEMGGEAEQKGKS